MNKAASYIWDLRDLYEGMEDSAIAQDLKTSDTLIADLQKYRGKVASLSNQEILALIKKEEELGFLFHKTDLFAGLLESTNVADPQITRFVKKIDEILITKAKETIFLEVEFAQLSEQKWQDILGDSRLQPYRHYLTHLYRDAQHTLSEPEEKILAEKSQTSSLALTHLYSITTNTLQFPWQRKKITLDELLTKFHDGSPEVRHQAARTLHVGLKANDRTTPSIYNALIQDKSISDRLRSYTFPEQARFMHDDVDKETVDALVESVTQSFHVVERYYNLKKQILGVQALYWWDRYAPLPEVETKIDLNQAKTMVVDAYNEFSPEMATIIKNIYNKRHIDWLPSATKRGGAFCAFGGKTIYPYILLNYTHTPRDVMTLAHELGHAAHDVLAQENNVFFQTHPSLAAAEIASVFGESILFDKLIHSDISKKDKVSLLMAFIEDTFATVFRQITMFQFEQEMHHRRRKEGEIAKEEIDVLWHEAMKKPYGKSLTFTDEHKNTWMYIPHIINTPFYVYSYAFAQLCVLTLVQEYKERGSVFVLTYLTLLRTGGSLSPKDNLKQAKLDITSKDFWQRGLELIEGYIDELENITH